LQVARVKLALLPDLPLQSTGATQSQAQAVTQQQSQSTQQTQTTQPATGQQQSSIPPQ
jgi:hypothetical protein